MAETFQSLKDKDRDAKMLGDIADLLPHLPAGIVTEVIPGIPGFQAVARLSTSSRQILVGHIVLGKQNTTAAVEPIIKQVSMGFKSLGLQFPGETLATFEDLRDVGNIRVNLFGGGVWDILFQNKLHLHMTAVIPTQLQGLAQLAGSLADRLSMLKQKNLQTFPATADGVEAARLYFQQDVCSVLMPPTQ
jgi:hypothetical protein